MLTDGLREEGSPLLRGHGLLDFATACAVAGLSGATQAGVRLGGSCVLAAAMMFACTLLLAGYYAVVRPFAARLEVVVATVQAGTLSALCGMTLLAVSTGGTAVTPGSLSIAGTLADAVASAAPVVLLIPVVRAKLCGPGAGGGTQIDGQRRDSSDESRADAPLLQTPSLEHGGVTGPPAPVAAAAPTSAPAVAANPLAPLKR